MKPRLIVAAIVCALAATAQAQPLTTAFTFQGELKSGAAPASGVYDFRFTLFDAPTGGAQLGPQLCSDNITLANGKVTVQLDFGSQFAGQQRYLEVQARQDTGLGCANGTGFVTLTPRQNLTAAPNAVFALNAGSASSATQLNGQPAGFYTNASNLTSGTLDTARLPVPFNLSGNVQGGSTQLLNIQNTNGTYGVGINSTATGIGLKAVSTATTGVTYGGQFTSNSDSGTGLLVTANNGETGLLAECSGQYGAAVLGHATNTSGNNLGVFGSTDSPFGIGIAGYGGRIGVLAQSSTSGSHALETFGPADGFAAYFNGRGYFSDRVGLGTASPAAALHAVRNWDGEDGALRLEGDKPTLRFTGGAAAGSQSWMIHVGSDGPGNLGFYNRTGPGSWQNIMALTPAGLAIGVTNTNQRPLYSRTSIIYPARFESTHPLATALEVSNTAANAVWEYGVAGTGAPFGLGTGSMYLFKQGNSAPGFSISPTNSVTTRQLAATHDTNAYAVRGYNSLNDVSGELGTYAIYAGAPAGVAGYSNGSAIGVYGHSFGDGTGVWGECDTGAAIFGETGGEGARGVQGLVYFTTATSYAVYGGTADSGNYAVYAAGRFGASGTKSFRIDHPQDPRNKYLLHYCSESPEVTNFYSGKVTLNELGEAVVDLPPYFAAINKDPRYTLTPIGASMPLLHIAQEVDDAAIERGNSTQPGETIPPCSFRIAGGAANGKVSWRVEALRNDRWVQTHGAPVEEEKTGAEKGRYEHPELFGRPPEEGLPYRPRAAVAPKP